MNEQGQIPPEDAIKLIAVEERLWVRVAATRNEAEWHESLIEVTSGVAPPRWIPQRWEYDEAIFISSEVSGADAAGWLRNDLVHLDGVDIKLPLVSPDSFFNGGNTPANRNRAWSLLCGPSGRTNSRLSR